jgi:hypothetical protein
MTNKRFKITGIITGLVVVGVLSFFLKACEKDELPQINNTNTSSENKLSQAAPTNEEVDKLAFYPVLTIEHSAAQTKLPDYAVQLNSNGTGLFTGRRNTAFIGEKKLQVSADVVKLIIERFNAENFSAMESVASIPDMPGTTTGYKADEKSEMVIKVDLGQKKVSARLMDLREYAEQMLNIRGFVYGARDLNNIQDNPNQINQ